MSTSEIALLALACIFGGAVLGTRLRSVIPEHHLESGSQDVIKLAAGVVATMAALILGLLVSSAKSSFDSTAGEITQLAADVTVMDRNMAHYGSEADAARNELRQYVTQMIANVWQEGATRPPDPQNWRRLEDIQDMLRALSPPDDAHRWLQTRALEISGQLSQVRWTMAAQQSVKAVPTPMLVVLIAWLTVVFAGFGLLAPRNPTVLLALLACAISVSGSLYLILEMERPFDGLIQISNQPVRDALARMSE